MEVIFDINAIPALIVVMIVALLFAAKGYRDEG